MSILLTSKDGAKHRTWIGTEYEDELMPEMTDTEYDAWYARSWISDGVRVGPMTRDYKIRMLLAWQKELREQMAVCESEFETLLDEKCRNVPDPALQDDRFRGCGE